MQQSSNHPYLCSELVTVTTCSSRETKILRGNLEEIGERNALVLVDSPLGYGTQLQVNTEGHRLRGQVRSWSFEPELGYFVDVQLDADSRWSMQRFVPKHFVCPEELWGAGDTSLRCSN